MVNKGADYLPASGDAAIEVRDGDRIPLPADAELLRQPHRGECEPFVPGTGRASVAFDQPPDAAAPWRATEPAYHEARPDSALTTLIDHILESGDTRITWTLEMENGDVLRIHTDLIVTGVLPRSTIARGMPPMGTMEEL